MKAEIWERAETKVIEGERWWRMWMSKGWGEVGP